MRGQITAIFVCSIALFLFHSDTQRVQSAAEGPVATLNAGATPRTPAPPLNNKAPTVATDHLVCVPRCVCTALCLHRQPFPRYSSLPPTQEPGPAPHLNSKTHAVATDRLVYAPPRVCTAFLDPNPNPTP